MARVKICRNSFPPYNSKASAAQYSTPLRQAPLESTQSKRVGGPWTLLPAVFFRDALAVSTRLSATFVSCFSSGRRQSVNFTFTLRWRWSQLQEVIVWVAKQLWTQWRESACSTLSARAEGCIGTDCVVKDRPLHNAIFRITTRHSLIGLRSRDNILIQ